VERANSGLVVETEGSKFGGVMVGETNDVCPRYYVPDTQVAVMVWVHEPRILLNA